MRMELFSVGPITIQGYGFMIALGILVSFSLAVYRAKKYGMSEEITLDIGIISLVSAFLGAKILYVIVEFEAFLKDPASVLGSSGFVVYGGIILGILSAIGYCKIKKVKFLEYFDLLSAHISIGQGFGRLGCLMAGCCYGRETDSIFGIVFPKGCMAPAGVKLLPTQIISSIGDFIFGAILILYYKKNRDAGHTGSVGALYCILYGIGRFFIEMLRNDDRGAVGIFSTSQMISFGIVAVGIALMVWSRRGAVKNNVI